jgi:ATP-dependent protease ClpP protease subunit
MKRKLQHEKSHLMAAKKANVLEMYIYGQIGHSWYDNFVTAADVSQALKDAGHISGINLRLNSPGGSVFEASAIYSLLQSKGVPINVFVDGLAASAAFTVAMVGTTISISEAAMMMCHNAWGMCVGNAADMIRQAELLNQINGVMAGIYAKRSGLALDEVAKLMDAETWLAADEAVAKGFATSIMKPETEDTSAKALVAQWDMSKFARAVPESLKAADDVECTCPCSECVAGDCDDCSDVGCTCDGCDCDQEPIAAAIDYSLYERRLRAAELA